MPSQQDKTNVWYNTNTQHYAQQAEKYPPQAQLNDFARLMPSGSYVLDAGCGSGRDSSILTQKGYVVTGIDLSHGLIEHAKKTFPHISFIEGSFLDLPFEDCTYDGVWAHASLVHLESIELSQKAIQELTRVLKPNGIIHIMVKAKLNQEKYATVIDKRNNSERFFQFYTQDELLNLTKNAGLEKIKLYQFPDKNTKQKYDKPVEWIVFLGKKIN